jgi:hypothetical protein
VALATLTVDFNARLANLETAVKRSADLTEKQASVMSKAYEGVGSAVRNLGGVLAGVFAVGTITTQFRALVDGLGELANAADATGASVETLSALDDIARRNGRSIGDVTELVQELNKALKETDDSNQAKALAAIGLSAQELRRLDPGAAVKVLADRLNELEDGGNKTRIALTILGESAGQYAPLLKEIAREGALVASITKEQAEAARDYNRQVATATVELSNFGRQLALDILPVLTRYTRELNAASEANLTLADRLKLGLTVPASAGENLNKLRAELNRLNQSRESFEARGMSTTAIDNNIQSVQRRIDYFKRLQAEQALADGASYSNEGRRGIAAPDISNGGGDAAKKAAEANKRLLESLTKESNAALVRMADEQISAYEQQLREFAQQQDKLNEAAQDGAEQVTQILAQMDLQRVGLTDEQVAAADALNSALATQAARYRDLADPAAKYREQLDEIARLGRTFDENGNPLLNEEQVKKASKAINEQAEAVEKNVSAARELGLTFSSAFEDAVINGEKLSNVLDGIAKDVARIFIRKQITERLAESIGEIDFKSVGKSALSLFGFADGGIMTSAGPVPLRKYAGGGIANSPQLAVFAEGGVREAFVPVPSGRIPVELRGSVGGGATQVNVKVINNTSAQVTTRSGASGDLELVIDQVDSAIGERVLSGRGGTFSAMQNRFGLRTDSGGY